MRRLLRIPSDTQLAADLEDEHRGVEGEVVELFSHVLGLLVEIADGIFDAFQNVKADLDSVLARQLLVILRVRLVVGLGTG